MLRQLHSIHYLVSASVFQSLVTALVLCRLDYGNSMLAGLPVYLQRRLQSVQNAAARLIFRLRHSDHITDAIVSLPECITYKVDGDIPQYLWQFVHVADVPSRHRLQSSTSDELLIPAVQLTSIDSRAFPVAGARIWNTLALHVTAASSLTSFKLTLSCTHFVFPFLDFLHYDFLVVLAVSVAT